MTDKANPEEELLKESRRTTHAVRAIARFILLIVTYQVVATILIGLGVGLSAPLGDEAGFGWVLIGVVVSIAGLVHALMAGHNELALSNRKILVPAPNPPILEADLERDERGLLPGYCSCTRWERGVGGTSAKENVEYCLRCERVVP